MSGDGLSSGKPEIPMKPGLLLLISPGTLHAERSIDVKFLTIWVDFKGNFMPSTRDRIFSLEDRALLTEMESLLIFSREQGEGIGPELVGCVGTLAHRFLRKHHRNLDTGSADFVTRAIRYIETHFREPLAIPELARQLGCSGGYLHRSFKARTGHTPINCLRESSSPAG